PAHAMPRVPPVRRAGDGRRRTGRAWPDCAAATPPFPAGLSAAPSWRCLRCDGRWLGLLARRLRGLLRGRTLQEHEVVAMDDLVPATPAQDRLDLVRPVAGDPFGVGAGIGGQAAGEARSIGADDKHGIAALE